MKGANVPYTAMNHPTLSFLVQQGMPRMPVSYLVEGFIYRHAAVSDAQKTLEECCTMPYRNTMNTLRAGACDDYARAGGRKKGVRPHSDT